MNPDLTVWRAAAEEAARLGAARLEEWRARFSVREKAQADLVTEADHASQQAIRTFLMARFPAHDFLGEEDLGAKEGRLRPDVPTWIVDPLDGTANYVHDVPAYCVSVGFAANGELVAGAIYDPRQGEMFSAATGLGATLNGRPIRVSAVSELRAALLATGFPPDPRCQERNLHYWRTFAYRAQALRRTGSTALNLAYVAAGRFDGYWAYDNWAWDIAAGAVLVREAGGVVTRADGLPLDPFRPDIVAANRAIHAAMIERLAASPFTGNAEGVRSGAT
ncbi:MAG TPA: inositol monophosphatase family protein [Gemmataceae bacterium]|nr:inositol monophosphatase family protein [Gemmataceae bacterium]